MWFLAPMAGMVGRFVASSMGGTITRSAIRVAGRIDRHDGDDDRLITVNVKSNLADARRYVGDIGKQVRYASAVALTRTTRRLVPIMEGEVRRSFDRPTPFTVRAFGTTPATKANLTSTLFIRDRQAQYLLPNIKGGRRRQKAFESKLAGEAGVDAYWAPGAGVRLTAAGNMTVRQVQDIANKLRHSGRYSEVFVGVPRGHPGAPFGIWARAMRGRGKNRMEGLKPLLVKIAAPHYKPRFNFYAVANRHAQRIFSEEFDRAFEQAMRTVKPISPSLSLIRSFTIRV